MPSQRASVLALETALYMRASIPVMCHRPAGGGEDAASELLRVPPGQLARNLTAAPIASAGSYS